LRAAGVYGHTYGLHRGYPWVAGCVSVELVRDEFLENNNLKKFITMKMLDSLNF